MAEVLHDTQAEQTSGLHGVLGQAEELPEGEVLVAGLLSEGQVVVCETGLGGTKSLMHVFELTESNAPNRPGRLSVFLVTEDEQGGKAYSPRFLGEDASVDINEVFMVSDVSEDCSEPRVEEQTQLTDDVVYSGPGVSFTRRFPERGGRMQRIHTGPINRLALSVNFTTQDLIEESLKDS